MTISAILLIVGLLIALSIPIALAMIWIVGHETEERPGMIEAAPAWPAVVARAQTAALTDELERFEGRVVRIPIMRDGVGIHGDPLTGSLDESRTLPPLTAEDPRFASGIDVLELTEQELAARVARQEIDRGEAA